LARAMSVQEPSASVISALSLPEMSICTLSPPHV